MIRIAPDAWKAVIAHAERAYPEECCGALLGTREGGMKTVSRAAAIENSFAGDRTAHYGIRPEDLLEADRAAREAGLRVVGIYHSHPDRGAYFSDEDLRNSCPWYSFVVLAVRGGRFEQARSFVPRAEAAEAEELVCY